MPRTRNDDLAALRTLGIATDADDLDHLSPAVAYALNLTAGARHASRVDATIDAARAFLDGMDPSDLQVAALVAVDLHMTGGPGGMGGLCGGTDRLLAFQKLGKGRYHASDGGCYRAAAIEALHKLCPCCDFAFSVDEDGDLYFAADPDSRYPDAGGCVSVPRFDMPDMVPHCLSIAAHGLATVVLGSDPLAGQEGVCHVSVHPHGIRLLFDRLVALVPKHAAG